VQLYGFCAPSKQVSYIALLTEIEASIHDQLRLPGVQQQTYSSTSSTVSQQQQQQQQRHSLVSSERAPSNVIDSPIAESEAEETEDS
jgi:hypothetical protein